MSYKDAYTKHVSNVPVDDSREEFHRCFMRWFPWFFMAGSPRIDKLYDEYNSMIKLQKMCNLAVPELRGWLTRKLFHPYQERETGEGV